MKPNSSVSRSLRLPNQVREVIRGGHYSARTRSKALRGAHSMAKKKGRKLLYV